MSSKVSDPSKWAALSAKSADESKTILHASAAIPSGLSGSNAGASVVVVDAIVVVGIAVVVGDIVVVARAAVVAGEVVGALRLLAAAVVGAAVGLIATATVVELFEESPPQLAAKTASTASARGR